MGGIRSGRTRHDSVVVVLELMPYGADDHISGALDLEQRDIARSSKGNDQLTQERALPCLATSKGRRLQGGNAGANGRYGLLGQGQVTAVTRQFCSRTKSNS